MSNLKRGSDSHNSFIDTYSSLSLFNELIWRSQGPSATSSECSEDLLPEVRHWELRKVSLGTVLFGFVSLVLDFLHQVVQVVLIPNYYLCAHSRAGGLCGTHLDWVKSW